MKYTVSDELSTKISQYLDSKHFKQYIFENLVYLLMTGYLIDKDAMYVEESMNYHMEKDNMDRIHAIALGKVNGILGEGDFDYKYDGFVDFSFYKYIKDTLKVISAKDLIENPFLKKFIPYFMDNPCNNDEFFIELMEFYEEDIDIYDIAIFELGLVVPKICVSRELLFFPSIIKNEEYAEKLGMFEVNEFNSHVENAHGNVLCFGFHFGYFPYMAALKDNVEKITVVLDNENEIEFLKDHIFKDFEYSNKIEIINSSDDEYLKNLHDGDFDFIFVSNYDFLGSLENYLKMKDFFKSYNKSKVGYMVDEFFANTIAEVAFTYFYLEYLKESKTNEELVKHLEEFAEQDNSDIYRVLLNKIDEIHADNLDDIFSYKNMLDLLNK